VRLILFVIAIIVSVGLKPAAAAVGFLAIGLGLLSIALYWPQTETDNVVTREASTDEFGSADFNKSTTDFLQRMRQRLFSMA
jgi:hypothetical protein